MKLQWIFMGLMLMFIASACTKDALNTKDEGPALKKAELKISSEFSLYLDEPGVNGLPVAGRLEGIIPHLGKIQVGSESDFRHESFWEDPSPKDGFEGDLPDLKDLAVGNLPCLIYENTTVHFIAANGDELRVNVDGFIYDWMRYGIEGRSSDGLSWIGKFTYIGGTGRFKDVIGGGGTTTGKFLPGSNYSIMIIKMEGTMPSVGQSKK